jgi:hypothetical protein
MCFEENIRQYDYLVVAIRNRVLGAGKVQTLTLITYSHTLSLMHIASNCDDKMEFSYDVPRNANNPT